MKTNENENDDLFRVFVDAAELQRTSTSPHQELLYYGEWKNSNDTLPLDTYTGLFFI